MRVDDFDYHLPEELIALRPASPRDGARLLVVEPGADPLLADRKIADLPELLSAGDALVFNDTKVIPAELKGRRERDGSSAHDLGHAHRPPRRKPLDGAGEASEAFEARRPHRVRRGQGGVPARHSRRDGRRRGADGEVTLGFDLSDASLDEAIARARRHAASALHRLAPPADEKDRIDYQTIFAREEGAVAAPTAGLHFTDRLMRGAGSARRLAPFRDAACRRPARFSR